MTLVASGAAMAQAYPPYAYPPAPPPATPYYYPQYGPPPGPPAAYTPGPYDGSHTGGGASRSDIIGPKTN
jgi:hypothetical protein